MEKIFPLGVNSMPLQSEAQLEVPPVVKPSYRSDIDGLRAIAVLAVVSYHYLSGAFPGGYCGVDIFFVISGYLLSSIVISEVETGRFSISRFYERRIRRIFPALFALLACATVFACFFLLPTDLVAYSRSMLASSLSASNFYFWLTSNYFAAPAADIPLLHTWSLAVEEQFYLLFPVFIVLTYRYFSKHLRAIVTLVAVASFIWSAIQVRRDPGGAFYLPFSRAWELLAGTILAMRMIPVPRSQKLKECLAAAGIAGMALSVFVLTDHTPFPGAAALLPCGAAGATILASQEGETRTGRLLSWKPIAFIGLISYSLYLWHWPLLVFSKMSLMQITTSVKWKIRLVRVVLLVAAFVISAISWRFVETPFRTGPRRPGKRTVFIFGASCLVAFCAFALILTSSRGLPGRFPPAANAVATYLDYPVVDPAGFESVFHLKGSCFLDHRQPIADFDESVCLPPAQGKKQVLIWGDSHAANLRPGLEAAMPDIQFLQATSSSCPPVLHQDRTTTDPECQEFVDKVINDYIPRKSIRFVLLSADWMTTYQHKVGDVVDRLRKMGVTVVIFGGPPRYDTALPRILARSIIDGKDDQVRSHLLREPQAFDAAISRLAEEKWHVPYVSLFDLLCSGNGCMEYASPGVPLQYDASHLTRQGSEYIGRMVRTQYPHIFDPQ